MDKKRYAVIEKYTTPFVQLVIEKGQQKDVFEKLQQIKDIFDNTHLVLMIQKKKEAFAIFKDLIHP